MAGGTLATTCTISGLSGALSAYRPGNWTGDGLDDLYNVGGTGTNNQLIVGLSNTVQGTTVTFSFACSTTLDGNPVPLAGLVMADAEQSGSNEYVEATIPAGGDWRIIDRIRTGTCSADTAVTRTGQTLRMTGPPIPCGTGPDAVAFMDDVFSANVVMKGGGKSAIALGVMLFSDFGDAPATYGDAGALYSPGFTGGTVPAGASNVFGATLNTPTQPTTRLGAIVDSEATTQPSAGATSDGADEDAVGALGTVTVAPGATYTQSVACTGPGTVAGWIDWNRDGAFQTGERSGAVDCTGTSVALSWTVPADLKGGASFLRLRIGPNAASVAGPTGVTTAGEVEDHALVISATDFGDAPASYGTTVAGTGASHVLTGYNPAAGTAAPMLGTRVDDETDGAPSANADGDDAASTDDEDGVAFYTDVSVSGRLETVYVTSSAAGFLNGWIDFDRNGTFDTTERIFADRPVTASANKLTYTVPSGAAVVPGQSYARFRLTSAAGQATSPTGPAPNGEVEDYPRTLVDAQQLALSQCPAGSQPQAVSIIQNPSFETRTQDFAYNGSARTINFAKNWYDSHPTGGQYFLFRPDFDSGPAESTTWPWRAGADGYGFLGGHTSTSSSPATNDAGEGAANTLTAPLAAGTTYVGFFSMGAGANQRNGSAYMRFFGVSNKEVGSIGGTGIAVPTAANEEKLYDTSVVAPTPAGKRQQWALQTFTLKPNQSWPYLRVEARNAIPANNVTTGGQAFVFFDDFHLFSCSPVPTDFGDAPNSYGTAVADDGPRHLITGYDAAAHTSTLMIGATIDDESEGVPGASANGDDTAGVDDEDVTSVAMQPGVTTASTTVPVTNTTGSAATLYGWIDANGNGTFQATEAATVAVPNGASSATLSWTGLTATVDGAQPVVRLRLTSATLNDTVGTAALDERSQGAAPDGEVEDLQAVVGTVLPSECANPFTENFGTGAGYGPALPAGQTTYIHAASALFGPGRYAVMPDPGPANPNWISGPDHTPGDTNGRMMVVNASVGPDKFFQKTFTGLTAGRTYTFSSWITNIAAGALLPRVEFRVIDQATGAVLTSADTGSIPALTGPALEWKRYELTFTASAPTVRLEMVNTAPGGSGNDLAIDDISTGALCEHGDAPDSYGTLLASNGPVHGRGTPHLGATADYEGDGQPTAAADGDDAAGTDDEDGVTFNPALGYPNPTIRTGTDPVTLLPVQNTVRVNASTAGFASAWVDWNEDGDFADAGERVTDAQAVTAGNNDLAFAGAANPADIRTYVRVRYSTDAASIHTPTGAAPDGEVEDYQVLVERLVIPATCDPITDPYYALTATSITDHLNVNLLNETARYPGVTVVEGVAVDMLAAVTAGRLGSTGFSLNGDDPSWILASTIASVRLSFVVAGTTTPVSVNSALLVNDMDRLEVAAFQKVELEGSAIPAGSKVVVTQDTDRYLFSGTVTGTSDPRSRFQVWFRGKSVLNTDWRGSGFAVDGNGTLPPSCDDYGDAPDTYKTLFDSDGPHHRVNQSVRLGAKVEIDGEGQPTAAADGDDTDLVDDEDGVTFNPALGYPNPTIRTGPDPITLAPVVNHVTVNASAAGFVSVWVDWNEDGDFADAGERVADAQPVTAGNNDVTFSQLVNPPDIRTYVRVRYGTDAASIHTPTGAAPDGEVEDYQVLVERLISPAACSPVTDPYYAMTFNSVTDKTGAGAAGTTARYPNVSVVKGEAVDMIATTGSPGATINANGFFVLGDDAAWNLNGSGSNVQISYAWVKAGTTTPVAMNSVWTIGDMDSGERTDYIPDTQVAGYAVTPGSKVSVSQTGGRVIFVGTVNGSNDVTQRYQVWFQGKSSVVAQWRGFGSSGFVLDGDGDTPVPKSCDDYGDAPDSYKTLLASDGPHHTVTPGLSLGADSEFDADGQPTAGADGDDLNRNDDEDGVAAPITQSAGQATTVQVSATNSTATAATLAGWIDLNRNGTFDPAERVTVAVPASSGTATYPVTFPVSSTNSDTYARFRLFPGSVASPLPTGAATAGEVEDYAVTGNLPVVTCATDAALFNTAYNGAGGKTAVGLPDRNWQVAAGNSSGPASAGAYIPAWVVAGNPAWYQGTFGNASWISYYANSTQPAGSVDLYFRYTFRIDPEVSLTGFVLPMEFFADNSVPDVWVNGVSQDPFETSLPQSAGAPYTYAGFLQANKAATSLSHGFQTGLNTIVVRVASNSPAAGFMAQINAQALCTDRGDAPDTYGTTGVTGASHGLPGYDAAAHTANLMIGSLIDAEGDGAPGAAANGDDTAGVDDEDGVAPISVTKGSAPSIDVKVTNTTAAPATLAGWVDLDKSGTFDANERAVATVAPATLNGTVTLTFAGAVTTTQDTYARFRLFPGVVASPPPSGQATGGEVEDYAVTTLNPTLSVTKTSDATASSKPGDVVHYTVKLTNTGSGAFTVANPARMLDDLTGVLDDATYNADAAADVGATPSYAAPRIAWSGPLAAGQTVTVTYSVTLKGGGDGTVRNVAFAPPGTNPNPPTPDCTTPGGVPCAAVETLLPKLTITKTANRTALPAVGQTIVYTVTVGNAGPGDFTAAHLATFSDDLSAVLDDATMNVAAITASRGTATFTSPNLAWSGTLPAGQSATITYTLTYTGAGDHQLDNSACVPVSEALDPADTCRSVSVPGSGLRHDKSVDPASGTAVQVGQVLTYTLTFENVGPVPATVDSSDDLSDVLDDAQLVGAPIAGAGLTATVNGNQLDVTGTVPAGATRTVTYQVQVRPWAAQGDHVLANALACESGEPAGCAPETTTNPVAHLVITKSSNRTVDSEPGDTITYTVTGLNDGPGDFTAADQAPVVDDLTGVLDDATYGNDAAADRGAAPTYAAPRITWVGALAHGDTVTITYTVVLKGGGDGHVRNVAWQPVDPNNPGPPPDCAVSPRPCDTEVFDLPKLTIKKTSNRAQLPAAGQKITYTVTVTNPGPGDYTAAHPATFSDDLTDVLDDATFDAGSITATTGAATLERHLARLERCPGGRSVRHRHLHADLPGQRQPRRGQPRLRPADRGQRPRRRVPHRAHARLRAAALQVRRPGQRHAGDRGPGPHLHADLRERRPGRGHGQHLRRPLRRRRRRRARHRVDHRRRRSRRDPQRRRRPDRHHRHGPDRRHAHRHLPGHGQGLRRPGRPRRHQRARLRAGRPAALRPDVHEQPGAPPHADQDLRRHRRQQARRHRELHRPPGQRRRRRLHRARPGVPGRRPDRRARRRDLQRRRALERRPGPDLPRTAHHLGRPTGLGRRGAGHLRGRPQGRRRRTRPQRRLGAGRPQHPRTDAGLRHLSAALRHSDVRPAQAHRGQVRGPGRPPGDGADGDLHGGGDQPGSGRLHGRAPGDVLRRPVRGPRRRDARRSRPRPRSERRRSPARRCRGPASWRRASRRRSPTRSPTGPPATTCSTTPRASRPPRPRCRPRRVTRCRCRARGWCTASR